jgi:hypothetical protein
MKCLILILVGTSLASAAGAQAQQPPTQAPVQADPASNGNPNEVVCERQSVIGTRLAHRKVCMTRSQWQDAKRQDREAVEKAQMQRGMGSGG